MSLPDHAALNLLQAKTGGFGAPFIKQRWNKQLSLFDPVKDGDGGSCAAECHSNQWSNRHHWLNPSPAVRVGSSAEPKR